MPRMLWTRFLPALLLAMVWTDQSAAAGTTTYTVTRQAIRAEVDAIRKSSAYRSFLSYKRRGKAQDSALYRKMAAALKSADPLDPSDPLLLRDGRRQKELIKQFAYCHLAAEEELPTLLPDVLTMFPYPVSLVALVTAMDRRGEQLSAKDIYDIWPAAYPFLVLPPEEVLPILEEHLFSLPTYEARRAAFELAEVVRLRASGKDVSGSRALNRFRVALSDAGSSLGTTEEEQQ